MDHLSSNYVRLFDEKTDLRRKYKRLLSLNIIEITIAKEHSVLKSKKKLINMAKNQSILRPCCNYTYFALSYILHRN